MKRFKIDQVKTKTEEHPYFKDFYEGEAKPQGAGPAGYIYIFDQLLKQFLKTFINHFWKRLYSCFFVCFSFFFIKHSITPDKP